MVERKIKNMCYRTIFGFVLALVFPSISPPCLYIIIRRGVLMEGLLHYKFGELIFGEPYFQNVTVLQLLGESIVICLKVNLYAVKKSHNNNYYF